MWNNLTKRDHIFIICFTLCVVVIGSMIQYKLWQTTSWADWRYWAMTAPVIFIGSLLYWRYFRKNKNNEGIKQ